MLFADRLIKIYDNQSPLVRKAVGGVIACLLAIIALDYLFPPPMERLTNVSTVVTDRHGQMIRAFPIEDGRWRLQADLDELDNPWYRVALMYELYDDP
jgi:penicillin-binding protein 1C